MKCQIASVLNTDGYGKNRKGQTAHRSTYTKAHGAIPQGYEIHHLCGNRACTKPRHLIALSFDDHRKLHQFFTATCRNGHKRTDKSTYVHDGTMRCRICNQSRVAEYKARKNSE